jgi:hypothetical protein
MTLLDTMIRLWTEAGVDMHGSHTNMFLIDYEDQFATGSSVTTHKTVECRNKKGLRNLQSEDRRVCPVQRMSLTLAQGAAVSGLRFNHFELPGSRLTS